MLSKKSKDIPPFIVMEILEKAQKMEQEGISVIHLEIGEPDFETPKCIKDAACQAIGEGKTQYTHSLGLIELREAISNHYHEKYNVTVNPEQIIITSGTSPAMFLIFGALLDSKNEVILSNPSYACYPNIIKFIGGTPVYVNVYEEDGFQYRPEKIKEKLSKETKAIFVNSPSNPTGNLLEENIMKKIAQNDCFIVSDEIYHGLVYEGKEHSILEYTDKAFVLNGFSKLYAMTGWRLGYVIAPKEFIRPMQKIQQNFFISANNFVQRAGIAALTKAEPDIKKMIAVYDERRKFIIPRLKELGFGITVEPTGAFYVLANAKHFSNDSYRFAIELLEKAKVAVTPGIDFGDNAEGCIRFSYANSLENIKKACNRIEKYLLRLSRL